MISAIVLFFIVLIASAGVTTSQIYADDNTKGYTLFFKENDITMVKSQTNGDYAKVRITLMLTTVLKSKVVSQELPVVRIEIFREQRLFRMNDLYPSFSLPNFYSDAYSDLNITDSSTNHTTQMQKCTLNTSRTEFIASAANWVDTTNIRFQDFNFHIWSEFIHNCISMMKDNETQSNNLHLNKDLHACIIQRQPIPRSLFASFFIEPIFAFNLPQFTKFICWDEYVVSYADSTNVGSLRMWHFGSTLAALGLCAFCPLLLVLGNRISPHMPNTDGCLQDTDADDRLSFDTHPLPFGIGYVLIYWDKPIKYRNKICFKPVLCLRFILFSFIIQLFPNWMSLIQPLVDEHTHAFDPTLSVVTYIASSVTTFVSLWCIYLVIFMDDINLTPWFAQRPNWLLFQEIPQSQEHLCQPNMKDSLLSENINIIVSIMVHRLSLLWRLDFWKFIFASRLENKVQRKRTTIITIFSKIYLVVFVPFIACLYALPITGYMQLIYVQRTGRGYKKALQHLFRIVAVVFSFRMVPLVAFCIVKLTEVSIYILADPVEFIPPFTVFTLVLVLIIQPFNGFFNIYCKLFYLTLHMATNIQGTLRHIAENKSTWKTSTLSVRGVQYLTLLEEAEALLHPQVGDIEPELRQILTSFVVYTKDDKATIKCDLFHKMVNKHQPIGWTIVVHIIASYLVPLTVTFLVYLFYVNDGNLDYKQILESVDTSVYVVLVAVLTILGSFFSSQEQYNCKLESIKAEYALDVLSFVLQEARNWQKPRHLTTRDEEEDMYMVINTNDVCNLIEE